MGLFDDLNQFLEDRLEEFLRNNPHLELQAIEEQLREQERDSKKLILELQNKEKSLQEEILSIARDIQTWHGRIDKAKAAGRQDLASAAAEREASLLRQGNQLWGQMGGVKQRLVKTREILTQIQQRIQEVKVKAAQVKTTNPSQNKQDPPIEDTYGWNQGSNYQNYNRTSDPLEAKFKNWELDEEIEKMKRNLDR